MRRVFAVGGLISFAIFYAQVLRRPIMIWGATEAEARASLPGDELLPDPDGESTRAISIDVPPEDVWPWIAQIGPEPRGGVYTYDWIENLLGLNIHSTDRILEEFQNPQVGDEIGLGSNKMVLELVDRPHTLAWRSADGNWLWSFNFVATPGGSRLISRNRFKLPRLADRIGMIPMEPGSLVMERKMLLGVKQRAERLAASRAA